MADTKSTQDRMKVLKALSDRARASIKPDIDLVRAFVIGSSEEKRVAWTSGLAQSMARKIGKTNPSLTFNWLLDTARNWLALYLSMRIKATCQAITTDESDIRKAKAASLVFDHFWRERMVRGRILQRFLWEMILGSTTILRLDWDRWLGDLIERPKIDQATGEPVVDQVSDFEADPETGEPIEFMREVPQTEQAPRGDIHCRVLNAWDVDLDPEVQTLDEQHDLVHRYAVAEWEFRERWPKSVDKVQPTPLTREADKPKSGTRSARGDAGRKAYQVAEYFQHPNSQHPRGYRAIFAATEDREVLEEGECAVWPLAECLAVFHPDSFWGVNPLRAAVDYLAMHNEFLNRIHAISALHQNPAYENGGLKETEGKQIPTEPGTVLPPGLRRSQTPDLPHTMLEMLAILQEAGVDATGITKAMLGREASATSGRQLAILDEQALRSFGPVGEVFEAWVEMVGTRALLKYREFGGDMLVSVFGSERAAETRLLTSDKWEAGRVVVATGSGIPKNEAIRRTQLMDLVEAGLTQDLSPREIRQMYGADTLSTDIDREDEFKRAVQDEIDHMKGDEAYVWDVLADRDILIPDLAYKMFCSTMLDGDFRKQPPELKAKWRGVVALLLQIHAEFMAGVQPAGGGGEGEQPPAEGGGAPQAEGVLTTPPGGPGQADARLATTESMGVNPKQEIRAGMGDIPA